MNNGLDTTVCKYCGKLITCHFVKRAYCNATCNRNSLYFMESMGNIPKRLPAKYIDQVLEFREYLIPLITSDDPEPIIYYKDWEHYLRLHTMPQFIQSLLKTKEPLPHPRTNFGSVKSITEIKN